MVYGDGEIRVNLSRAGRTQAGDFAAGIDAASGQQVQG